VLTSAAPVKEALYLGIPCLGVVDTNTPTNVVSIPFPGNDESIDCMVFYNDIIANYVLLRKFAAIAS